MEDNQFGTISSSPVNQQNSFSDSLLSGKTVRRNVACGNTRKSHRDENLGMSSRFSISSEELNTLM